MANTDKLINHQDGLDIIQAIKDNTTAFKDFQAQYATQTALDSLESKVDALQTQADNAVDLTSSQTITGAKTLNSPTISGTMTLASDAEIVDATNQPKFIYDSSTSPINVVYFNSYVANKQLRITVSATYTADSTETRPAFQIKNLDDYTDKIIPYVGSYIAVDVGNDAEYSADGSWTASTSTSALIFTYDGYTMFCNFKSTNTDGKAYYLRREIVFDLHDNMIS